MYAVFNLIRRWGSEMDQEQLNGWIPSIRAEELLEWAISNSTPDHQTQ